jgi:fatty-acyl-CoA synthase
MLGYYRDPEATAAAFTLDGWFRTGDVAVMHPDSYFDCATARRT